MIKSMTGYGSFTATAGSLTVTAEIKSVNNRFLDVSVRVPRSYLYAEDAVRSAVRKSISRGKVDVFVTVDASGSGEAAVRVNEALLEAYLDAFRSISDKFGLENDISVSSVVRIPDVLLPEKKDTSAEEITALIVSVVEQAVAAHDAMRTREGEKLFDDVSGRLDAIDAMVDVIERTAPQTVENYRRRLYDKISELLADASVDESRLLTETAIFADRIAVDEETVRLRSHVSQLRKMLQNGSPIGKSMDFLMQEFNREANTIGSKCQNSDIAEIVVRLKAEIEKIREQIQNIE